MTAEELKDIFKHQTTASDSYTPSGTLEYIKIDGQTRLSFTHNADDIAGIVPALEGFVFDAYRDRTPIFIKPEVIIPM